MHLTIHPIFQKRGYGGGLSKGIDEYVRDSAGSWNDVQDYFKYSYDVLQQNLGGDRVNVEDHVGASPPGVQTDCGYDRKTCDRQDVGIYLGGGGARSSRLITIKYYIHRQQATIAAEA